MLSLLKPLSMFEAVIRNKSFTKAANEHQVSSSAISHEVESLEEYLGVKLLVRSDYAMTLTEEGSSLYKDLAKSKTLLERGFKSLKASKSPTHH